MSKISRIAGRIIAMDADTVYDDIDTVTDDDMGYGEAEYTDEEDMEYEDTDEPSEDDYVLSPAGRLGGETSVSHEGRHLGNFPTDEEALDFIRIQMDKDQFWPGIWLMSDHGNLMQIDIEGHEIR